MPAPFFPMITQPYKPPILAQIFRIAGFIDLAVTAVGAVVLLLGGFATERAEGFGTGLLGACIFGVSGLASALLLIGLGQLIDYIGQIAFNSRILIEVIERQGHVAFDQRRDSLGTLQKLMTLTRQPREAATREKFAARPSASAPPPLPELTSSNVQQVPRYYYQGFDGEAAGPVTERELAQLHSDAVISDETLVCPVDGENWTRLDEIFPP